MFVIDVHGALNRDACAAIYRTHTESETESETESNC